MNFVLKNNSTVLAVSDLMETLLIYDVNSRQIITRIVKKISLRLLVFSADNRFLIVGDEHIAKIIRIDLKNSRAFPYITSFASCFTYMRRAWRIAC